MTKNVIDMEINPTHTNNIIKTPGILLREARRTKKLKQSDVAKEIRLSVQWIKDLEQDNYSRVPALIYLRGYLRSYARFIGILPDKVMAAFDEIGLEEEFKRMKAQVARPVQHHAVPVISRTKKMINGNVIRWIAFVSLIVLIIFVSIIIIWWQGKKNVIGQLHPVVMPVQESLPLK